jgi:hypothetical protein
MHQRRSLSGKAWTTLPSRPLNHARGTSSIPPRFRLCEMQLRPPAVCRYQCCQEGTLPGVLRRSRGSPRVGIRRPSSFRGPTFTVEHYRKISRACSLDSERGHVQVREPRHDQTLKHRYYRGMIRHDCKLPNIHSVVPLASQKDKRNTYNFAVTDAVAFIAIKEILECRRCPNRLVTPSRWAE